MSGRQKRRRHVPITVACSCGKVFKVKDEAAGGKIRCQVCGAELTVPAGGATPPASSHTETPSERQEVPSGNTKPCPACAEDIPSGSVKCPYCGESLKGHLSSEDQEALLQQNLKALDDHMSDPGKLDADEKLRGGFLAVKTIIVGVIAAGAVVMMVAGFSMRHPDAEALAGFGVILFLIFGIASLVSLAHDYGASHIQDASTPEKALRRYLMAIRTGRTNKAYASVSPGARKVGEVETVKYDKIPPNTGKFSIDDVATFKKYWRSVFRGPSRQTRGLQLKRVKKVKEIGEGVAVVEVECLFTNFPSLVILTILISWLICLILVLILQKKTKVVIRKLLVKRNGKWYIADGEFEGPLDGAKPKRRQAPRLQPASVPGSSGPNL
jgi:ribosomal protein S27E